VAFLAAESTTAADAASPSVARSGAAGVDLAAYNSTENAATLPTSRWHWASTPGTFTAFPTDQSLR
jgi:hypothetical protein